MQLDSGTGIKLILALLFLHMLSIGMTQMVVPLYSLTLGASPLVVGLDVHLSASLSPNGHNTAPYFRT